MTTPKSRSHGAPGRWAVASLAALAAAGGCAPSRIPTIEDHYTGATSAGSHGTSSFAPISYRESEVSFDPVVPIRTGPDTIAVLELGHAGDDGTWIAPHYVVMLIRPEGWADQLEPTSARLLSRTPASPVLGNGPTAAPPEADASDGGGASR